MNLHEYIADLQERSGVFHNDVETVLTYTSPDDVLDAMLTREQFRTDAQKAIDTIADKIGELESMKRKLRQLKSDQKMDIEKMDAYKWSILREKKHMGA